MAVKFTKSTPVGTLYEEGEIAAFDAETEKRLIDQEFAVKVKSADKPAEPAA